MKRYFRILLGIVLVAGAIFAWCKHRSENQNVDAQPDVQAEIDRLPDYDYVSEIKSLIKGKRYGEAIILCEDVQKLELPCASEVAALKTQAEKESKSVWNRIYKSGRAFVTGNPDGSIEEIGGSMVSDMVMYGDVRDLVKQGWYKVTGRETDSLVIALSTAGLVTEFVDVADWAPAVLKAFKKAGAISRKMADGLLTMCKKITKTRKVDKSAKAFFGNTKKMVESAGFIRTKNMFKNVDKVDDLAIVAKQTKANPALTHVVAKHSGEQTVEVLKGATPGFLKKVARKGRLAVRLFKSYHKHQAVIEKTFWQKLPKRFVNGFSMVFSLIGVSLILSGIIPLVRDLGKRFKKVS